MRKRWRSWVVVATVALVVSGCGDRRSEDERAVDAVASELLTDPGFARYDLAPTEAECVGETLVDDLGSEAVVSFDVEGLDQAATLSLGRALDACVEDVEAIVVDALARGIVAESNDAFPIDATEARCVAEYVAGSLSLPEIVVTDLDVDPDLPPDQAVVYARGFAGCVDLRGAVVDQLRASGAAEPFIDCMAAGLTDALLEAVFVAQFTGEPIDGPFTEIAATCD